MKMPVALHKILLYGFFYRGMIACIVDLRLILKWLCSEIL